MENINPIWEDLERIRSKVKDYGTIIVLVAFANILVLITNNIKGIYFINVIAIMLVLPMWISYLKWKKRKKQTQLKN